MTPLPDYDEALRKVLAGVKRLDETEAVGLAEAAGRVLAEPLVADRDLPPFNRSERDGYALRAAELKRGIALPVAATIHAGQPAEINVPPGQCVAVATGAPVPADLDTVIQHEQSDRGDPVRFTLDTVAKGQAIHQRGSDARAGDTLLAPWTVLAAQHLGLAAAVGRPRLRVVRRPRFTILTSGNEVVGVSDAVEDHQIRNSNAPMIAQLLQRTGAEPRGTRHLADDRSATVDAVGAALGGCDLLVTVGGLSAGDRDHFPAAFESLGVKTLLRGAAIQPGRPIFVGRAPNGAIVAGLPGNPVSVLACACLFCWPIVRVLLGVEAALAWQAVTLGLGVKPNPRRRAFRPAQLRPDGTVVVPEWSGSGDLAHTATTHGLVELPVQKEAVNPGARLRFLPWP